MFSKILLQRFPKNIFHVGDGCLSGQFDLFNIVFQKFSQEGYGFRQEGQVIFAQLFNQGSESAQRAKTNVIRFASGLEQQLVVKSLPKVVVTGRHSQLSQQRNKKFI